MEVQSDANALVVHSMKHVFSDNYIPLYHTIQIPVSCLHHYVLHCPVY